MKQALRSGNLPSIHQPRGLCGLCRIDDNRPDGVTLIPWEMGKQLVSYVTVVGALAPSRLNQGSSRNPGTTATDAEARKTEKYRNGNIFKPVAIEVLGSLGESSEFLSRVYSARR